jgi:hypothetical protein
MAQPFVTQREPVAAVPSAGMARTVVVWVVAGAASLAVVGALVLWFHYGTTVFFEMIASGISACF